MRYVVLGAGAVGGVIGGNLHLAGRPVTFVARGAHLDRIRADGLVLDRADGRHVVRSPVAGSAAEVDWSEPATVVLAVKSHQTAAALDELARHAPEGTVVVAAQNGVANEPAILRRFPSTYSLCVMLPATHLEPGVVVQKSWPVTPRPCSARRARHSRPRSYAGATCCDHAPTARTTAAARWPKAWRAV